MNIKRERWAFTIIELLIVVAVIGALLVGMLAALDPFEQLKKGVDSYRLQITNQFYNAVIRSYFVRGTLPISQDILGISLNSPEALPVLQFLEQTGELKSDFTKLNPKDLNAIYLTASIDGTTLSVCFQPESKSYNSNQQAIYNQFGNVADCSKTSCYICSGKNNGLALCKILDSECEINNSEKACCAGLTCVPYNPSSINGKCEIAGQPGVTPTAYPSLMPTNIPTSLPSVTPLPQNGNVWITWWNAIHRYRFDGTPDGQTFTFNPGNEYRGMAIVNNQVWVAEGTYNDVYRLNFDGSQAGPPLTGNGMNVPDSIAIVGSQVWVVNQNSRYISRFNFDGTPAGNPITRTDLYLLRSLAVVGTQVWVTNGTFRISNNSPIIGGNNIARFNFDGTPVGNLLTGNSLNNPFGIVVIGSQVWVTNAGGNYISRFNFDGSLAGTPITASCLEYPEAISIIGTQVWVKNGTTNTRICRFDFNGIYLGKIELGITPFGPQDMLMVP